MPKAQLLVLFSLIFGLAFAEHTCRFAYQFSRSELLHSQEARDRFLSEIAFWEGQFPQDRVGLNEACGHTYDGHGIDINTGLPADPLHAFSAPSKESLHLMALAHALDGNKYAQIFVSPSNPQNATNRAIEVLQKKIRTYNNFNNKYPGYGGYMPWVAVSDAGVEPNPDWFGRVPSLDNGEMIWGIYAVSVAAKRASTNDQRLRAQLDNIGSLYRAYFDLMAKNGVMMFYNGGGQVRAEAKIKNIYAQPTPDNYENNSPNYFLDDPYEGELFVFFLDLYGNWPNTTRDERELVWKNKRKKLVAIDYTGGPQGPITVQKGWWFSSHETWKVMELPYNDVPIHNQVFSNGEKARTLNSVLNNNPGLFAAASNFTSGGPIEQYVAAVGIQQIAFEQIIDHDLITPYGAFPVSLANLTVGLIWYHNMLLGSKMQGPFGSTEACQIQGKLIAPVLTWDTKITNFCAFLGGATELNRYGLKQDGKYDRFYSIIDKEWSRVFSSMKGSQYDLSLPTGPVPAVLPDFTTCKH